MGNFDFATAVEQLVGLGASDLHLKVGNKPLVRVHGQLRWLDERLRPLMPPDTEEVLHDILPEWRIAEFENKHEIDFAYSVPGWGASA